MRQLTNILNSIDIIKIVNNKELAINNICYDSRKLQSGDLFVAIKGFSCDGHTFINTAVEKGASVIVCEVLPNDLDDNCVYVQVSNSAKALGLLAANYYENPSKSLKLIAVCGTNGKTTITTLLYQLLTSLGYPTALISTVNIRIGSKIIDSTHTTPDPLSLNRHLKEMVESGCEFVFMEVSSHAVHQDRVYGVEFDGGVFTNITHDHLDYHKTFAEYLRVKKSFFDQLPKSSFAISNLDDKNGEVILQGTKARKKFYSLNTDCDYKGVVIENSFEGQQIRFSNIDFWTSLPGRFNAYNILATIACGLELGFELEVLLCHISKLSAAEGRFECLINDDRVKAIVDYAHTPDALDNVAKTICSIKDGNNKFIIVCGAGGNRDKKKRPEMAKVASAYSDYLILTSDNPRDEDPSDIIEDMFKGVPANKQNTCLKIVDRKEAIKNAALLAKPNDIILVAGKGHEKYQEIKGVKNFFDDKFVLKELNFI
ncbi:MAG: UDP-N-acetylmuramoyl-L-alanyl-D-glutamate--2,6-diaminopimelate ligase [Hyphomicrobiales bacterium]